MKEGTIYRSFNSKDKRQVTLRAPKWSDVDDYLYFINSLVEEKAMILMNEKQTRDNEIGWISRLLTGVERGQIAAVVAEVDDHLVGSCEISKKSGYSSHLGVLGISLLSGYRDVGIGQEMMLETEKQSSRIGVEIVELEVYSLNTRAVHVYERVGYIIVGRLSNSIKREGRYMDTFLMIKQLPLVL